MYKLFKLSKLEFLNEILHLTRMKISWAYNKYIKQLIELYTKLP